MRNYLIPAIVGLSLCAAPALALAYDGARLNVPKDQWLTPNALAEKLAAQGYTVKEIESDDGAYEVEMTKNGVRVEAHVHPATGEIMPGYDDD